MKSKGILTIVSIALVLGAWIFVPSPTVYAREVLKYACSNQVYTAFSKEAIAEFTQATGIKVDVKSHRLHFFRQRSENYPKVRDDTAFKIVTVQRIYQHRGCPPFKRSARLTIKENQ